MTFHEWMDTVVKVFEIAGVAVLAVGSAVALVGGGLLVAQGRRAVAYQSARRNVGRSILLGLEILIIADIVLTVTIDQTLQNAAILGIIVLVRTFLSFSLEIELEGTLPWRRRASGEMPPTELSRTAD
ncbi:MAG TPA: DUF1622 domain-containing protein [Candidatus Limnocylindrales bacterium]|nr:DUF1622 domain-containing protein [Candidatus Limnocylindrales bacterium]